MARLHADETFDRLVVEELRKLGHDVLTAREAGRANQRIPDHEVLDFFALATRIHDDLVGFSTLDDQLISIVRPPTP